MSISEERTLIYDSNASRREFLRTFGLASVGIMSCLWGCTRPGIKSRAQLTQLKLFGLGTLDIGDDGWRQLRQDLSVELIFKDNGNDTGPVITQMIAGNAAHDFDLGALQGGAEAELAAAGSILFWDLSKISNWNRIWRWARNIPYAQWQGSQYGLPIVLNADSMIYLPDKVGRVESYAAVFDKRWKGRTSMEDAWINSAIFTAMYLKRNAIAKIEDPGNLMPDELGIVMEFLIQKKKDGQFRKLWNGWEEGLQLVKSGEVWIMTGWEPIVYAAKAAGVNAEYAVPKEGYEGWSNDLLLHVGAKDHGLVDLAHKFANWELDGYYGCELSKLRGYVVPTDNAVEYAGNNAGKFSTAEIEQITRHVQNKFLKEGGQVFWQNVRPTHYKLYDQWWSKLRSA